jgi:hypothetical protein
LRASPRFDLNFQPWKVRIVDTSKIPCNYHTGVQYDYLGMYPEQASLALLALNDTCNDLTVNRGSRGGSD